MKKTIASGTVILILLAALAGCSQGNSNPAPATGSQDEFRVFVISGENNLIEISDGIIILTPGLEQFVGGELSFKGDELSGIKDFSTEFYFYLDGDKTVINSSSASIEGSEEGMIVNSNMGSTYSETLFSPEVWDTIFESLHFALSGTFINGETFEYNITLNVTEIANEMLSAYRPMIFLHDVIYGETADVVSYLPANAFLIGTIERVVPQTVPMIQVDFTSNAMPIGSEIYRTEDCPNAIYVQLPSGQYSIYIELE